MGQIWRFSGLGFGTAFRKFYLDDVEINWKISSRGHYKRDAHALAADMIKSLRNCRKERHVWHIVSRCLEKEILLCHFILRTYFTVNSFNAT